MSGCESLWLLPVPKDHPLRAAQNCGFSHSAWETMQNRSRCVRAGSKLVLMVFSVCKWLCWSLRISQELMALLGSLCRLCGHCVAGLRIEAPHPLGCRSMAAASKQDQPQRQQDMLLCTHQGFSSTLWPGGVGLTHFLPPKLAQASPRHQLLAALLRW